MSEIDITEFAKQMGVSPEKATEFLGEDDVCDEDVDEDLRLKSDPNITISLDDNRS